VQAPISVEVLSAEMAAKPITEVTQTLATATRAVIQAAQAA
jgi:hypothetical protein